MGLSRSHSSAPSASFSARARRFIAYRRVKGFSLIEQCIALSLGAFLLCLFCDQFAIIYMHYTKTQQTLSALRQVQLVLGTLERDFRICSQSGHCGFVVSQANGLSRLQSITATESNPKTLCLVKESSTQEHVQICYFIGENHVSDRPLSKQVLYRQQLGDKAQALVQNVLVWRVKQTNEMPYCELQFQSQHGLQYEWQLPTVIGKSNV